jgi:O-antigen/teichoic acid export membrane protein
MMLLFAWLAPLVMIGVVLPDALYLWLGDAYAQQMLDTSRLILAGVLVNGFALVPFTLLQAIGRSDITAKLHVVELPLFVAGIAALVAAFGVVGAALAWVLRVAFDAICLLLVARKLFPALSRQLIHLGLSAMAGICVVLGAALLHSAAARFVLAGLVLLATVAELNRRGGFAWLMSLARFRQ